MIKGIILIAFMVVIMVLMVTRKVPTLIAIPILAIGIAVIAGVPLTGEESIISTVIQSGAVKLAGSYTACLIATWMSCIMQRTGITENMIRKAAELGGDKTNIVAILLFLVICALSTVMSGLGAVIMMGTIAIPILISVGVEKFTAAAILLCAYGAGEHFGMVRATYFAEVFGLEVGQVYHFSVVVAITTGIAGLLYIITRLLMHEFFHYCEYRQGESSSRTHLVPMITIGRIHIGKTGVASLSEIAANSFVRYLWDADYLGIRTKWQRTSSDVQITEERIKH